MKVLQVVPFFSPEHGGSAAVAYHISRELAKRGHEVTILTSDYRVSEEWIESLRQVEIYPFRTQLSWAKFHVTLGMIRWARERIKYFDLIHMHNYRSFQNAVAYHYSRKHGVPYVFQAHGALPRALAKQGLKWMYDVFLGYRELKYASRVIALSQVEAQQYEDMGVYRGKIGIVPNGIDLSDYTHAPPQGSFKKKFNIANGKKIILYLGRISKTKGIEYLTKAYAHYLKNGGPMNVVLVIAGPDDGYLDYLKSLAQSLKLGGKVIFTGLLTEYEKKCALVDSSLIVYPSRVEPFGLVPLEAAAMARPVIVSRSAPIAAIVKRGEFGFSAEYGDIRGLAALFRGTLSDEELTDYLGKNGRRYVFSNFDWKKIVEKLEQVYRSVTHYKNIASRTRKYSGPESY